MAADPIEIVSLAVTLVDIAVRLFRSYRENRSNSDDDDQTTQQQNL